LKKRQIPAALSNPPGITARQTDETGRPPTGAEASQAAFFFPKKISFPQLFRRTKKARQSQGPPGFSNRIDSVSA
jgi:hypothetical protein